MRPKLLWLPYVNFVNPPWNEWFPYCFSKIHDYENWSLCSVLLVTFFSFFFVLDFNCSRESSCHACFCTTIAIYLQFEVNALKFTPNVIKCRYVYLMHSISIVVSLSLPWNNKSIVIWFSSLLKWRDWKHMRCWIWFHFGIFIIWCAACLYGQQNMAVTTIPTMQKVTHDSQ